MLPTPDSQLAARLCGTRCLLPQADPRCSNTCGRAAGHNWTHLCACPLHLRDWGAPPVLSTRSPNFASVATAMQKKGFDTNQARTMWHKGFKDLDQITTLTNNAIYRHLDEQPPVSSSAASSIVPLRADHPVLQPTLRGSRQDMFAMIASNEGREKALREIEDLTETANSRRNNESLWSSWTGILAAWGESPLPITPGKVKMVAASLRAGRYRSAEPYFHRARMEQIRKLHITPDAATLDAMRRYARAVARGVGPSKLKDAIPLELLADVMAPPPIEEISNRPPGDCIWPAALFGLGSWWLTRGIEASAAKIKHIAFGACGDYTVSWTLPASRTDVKALGSTRTHRCLCEKGGSPVWTDKRARLCPYHIMVEQVSIVTTLWEGPSSGELPLFPTNSGKVLTHAATVAAIHQVARSVGEPLQRDVDSTRLDRFGEHCMRVSGAQFLSRGLQWDLFVIQLFGRWGSLAVAKYVQEAPLSHATERAPSTSLAAVLKMVQEATQAARQPPDPIAEASIRADIEDIKKKLNASLALSIQDLSERAGITDNQDPDVTEPQEKLTVTNPASNVVHAVLVNSHESIPPEACITVCGWKWLIAGAATMSRASRTSSLPNFCKTCKKRETGAESDASSEEPGGEAESELGLPEDDEDLFDGYFDD